MASISNPSRRVFLRTTTSAAAAMAWSSRTVHAATDPLRVGVIGVGSQGRHHVRQFADMPGVQLAYVCDPDEKRRGEAAQGTSARPVEDLRRILDDPSIDAVSIATPDHWHSPAAILACSAGKHVYLEKPCCHNFREGQRLVQTAATTGRVVQHGTQQRSTRLTADAIQMLREGVIGEVLMAKAWNVQRRKNIGKQQPTSPPAGFDYDMWVGPAEMVPYRSNCHHYNWRWWYNFGTGDMGNDGAHELDYARWGLGVTSLPRRVAGFGGKYRYEDDQQFPDTQTVVFEFGDGKLEPRRQLLFEMRLWSRNYPYNCDSGVEFYGTAGKMMLSKRGKLEVLDDANKRLPNPRPQAPAHLSHENHYENFIAAIRQQCKPHAPIEVGFQSAALCVLGNLSTRIGRSFELDATTHTIADDDEANALLGRRYRDGGHWAVPLGLS